jgi:hypothetical protein
MSLGDRLSGLKDKALKPKKKRKRKSYIDKYLELTAPTPEPKKPKKLPMSKDSAKILVSDILKDKHKTVKFNIGQEYEKLKKSKDPRLFEED